MYVIFKRKLSTKLGDKISDDGGCSVYLSMI